METCYIKVNDGWEEVEFMGVFQKTRLVEESPLIGGYKAGSVSGPVAVVKIYSGVKGRVDGYLKEVDIDQLRFVEK